MNFSVIWIVRAQNRNWRNKGLTIYLYVGDVLNPT